MIQKPHFSKIIAGTMSWGNWGKDFSISEMVTQLHSCAELGITSFDHADIYGNYTTEREFGKALSESGVDRSKLQLISKCGIQLIAAGRDNKVKHYNYTKQYIIKSVTQSLKMLQTDYLDMLLLHRPSPLMHPDTISEAISQLKSEGKIVYFGVSNFNPSQTQLIEKETIVEANQFAFSLTENGVLENGVLDDCILNKRMAMCWNPLGSYFKNSDEQVLRIEKVMVPLCEKYSCTADQLLLAWIGQHPANIHPVVGTTEITRLKNAVAAIAIKLDLQDWFVLLEASKGSEVA